MVIVCLVAILFVKGILTEASDTTTEEIQLVTITNYTSSALEAEISNQRANNYLYAGLYKSGTTEDTLVAKNVVIESKVTEGSTYVAKFLPEGVMGIKAQVSEVLLSNPEATTSSVRFVTAVDSVLYKEVGFSITREGDTEGAAPIQLVKEGTISKYVYEKLYGVDVTSENPGEPLEYTPKDIHALANYFKTYTVTNVPEEAYNKDLTVTPYWITYDGVTVEGTTGIKSVNFGRSWVYINTSANTDGDQYGTYDHPYTDLADALDAIVLEKNGKIVIQNDSTITLAKAFTWSEHGKDLTITGEGKKTETLDFSAITNFRMGDGVTFENMTLKLPTSQLYADGHRFKIAENVVSNNSGVIIFGGGNGNDVMGDTSVTLLSGSYEAVYGGGLNGDVDGDTNVIIQNVNIYDTSKNNYRYVCGGGRKGNVTGDTYVTVGEGFNSEHEWENHSYLSAVFGGGYGADGNIAIVEGNTYVVIKDGAKTNYVHGAGTSYSEVKGTSHVTCDGGYAMCLYGGGSSVQAANASTSVVMKSGTVEQIFGGNQNGMTGNADVHILGGDILRRIYAGCYNEYEVGWNSSHAVIGYTSVTFGPDTYASLATEYDNSDTWYTDGDATYYAVSRSENNYSSDEGAEIGVFVLNDYDATNNPNSNMVGYTKDASYISSLKPYHYFVQSTTGGAVYSEGDSIRVVPDEGKVATVRVGSADVGDGTTVHAYLTSEGICKLPELDSSGKTEVYVVFTDTKPEDVDVSKYEATANGMHYTTLEEAISVANTLSTATKKEVVVNLLQENITVDDTLNIEESAKIKIQNADDVTATVNRADGLMSSKLLHVEKDAELSVNGVIFDGRTSTEISDNKTGLTSLTKGSTSLVTVSGKADFVNATIQYVYTSKEGAGIYIENKGQVTMTGGAISNNYVSAGSGGAVSVYSGTFTLEDGTISNNTASASGGAFMVRSGSSLTINDGTISDNQALVSNQNGGGAIFQHTNSTVNINGGTISENKSSYCGGAIYMNCDANTKLTISGAKISRNSSAKEGGGVYTTGAGVFTMTGGEISANTATVNGNGVYVGSNTTFTMSGGSVFGHGTESERNTIEGNAVCVAANATFTMSGTADISSNYSTKQGNGVWVLADGTFIMNGGTIQGNNTTDTGSGVAVKGSFVMNAGSIKDNTATKSAGGVIIRNTGTFSMTGGTIENNTAGQNGGGIYIQSDNKTTMEGGTVTNNKAAMGGGIFVGAGSGVVFEMSGGTIEKHGTVTDPCEILGAGVYVSSGKFNMTGGSIRNNHTTANGAGVYAAKTFNMSGTSEIYENSTTSDGGGVYVAEGVTYTMNNSAQKTIYDNEAANGGGVAVAGTFNMKKGFIANNITTTNGGGVYVNGGKFEMTTTDAKTISSNTAGNYGAGVYLNDGTFDMNAGSICNHGDGSTTTVTTAGAKEGAGVCAAGTSVVTMTGGSISNNYVSGSGAGISVRDTAQFIMNDGSISGNTAKASGGAMIVRSKRTETVEEQEILVSGFIMNGGAISDNHALVNNQNGGGAIWQAKNTQIELNGGTIAQNTSAYHGGGVYVSADTTFLLNGTTFAGNSTSKCGADIYLASKITLKKALTDAIAVGPENYAVGTVIAVNGGITDDEFIASMANITVDAYKGEYWSVNDNGALEAPIILDGVSYANLDEALENVAEESTITIYQDQELNSPVTVGGTLTITCTDTVSITASESFTDYMFTVAEEGKLVLTGASIEKKITLSGENVASRGIDSSGTLELENVVIKQATQDVRINKGTATLQGVDIRAFAGYGLVVKNGTVTVTDMVIDNVDVTAAKNRFGIAAHGGILNLDGVTIQNLVGVEGSQRASYAIDHIGGILNVTADATVDGENKGLYIYNIEGFGINSTGGTLNIAKIEIDGNSTTRAGIRLVNNANENQVANAKITGCSVQIQLQKESKLTIGETPVSTTGSEVANYDTDGTQQ